MTFNPEAIPADAVNVRDVSDDYRSSVSAQPFGNETQEQADERVRNFKLYLYDSHVGLCLEDRERNGYDDSDFYMVVWNPEKGEPESIEFASTRGWSYPCYGSSPDATPEVRAAYRAYLDRLEASRRKRAQEIRDAMPDRNKTLKVVKGRKVPVGLEGRCFWALVEMTYGPLGMFRGYTGRVGIEAADGSRHFTNVTNVEVIGQ